MLEKPCRLSQSDEKDLSRVLLRINDTILSESAANIGSQLNHEMCGWVNVMRINCRQTHGHTRNRTTKSTSNTQFGIPPTQHIQYDFRHYSNIKKYIEQYRKYHTCCGILERLSKSAIDGRFRTVYYSGEATHHAGVSVKDLELNTRHLEHDNNELRHHGTIKTNSDISHDLLRTSINNKFGFPLAVDVFRRRRDAGKRNSTRPNPETEFNNAASLGNRSLNLTPGRTTTPARPQLPYFPIQTPKQAYRHPILPDRAIDMFGSSGYVHRQTPSHPYDLYSRLVNAVTYLRAVKEKDLQMLSDSLIPIRSRSPNLSQVWIRGKQFMAVDNEGKVSEMCLPPLLPKEKPANTHHIGLQLPVFMRRKHCRQTIPSTKTIRQNSDVYRFSLKGNATGKRENDKIRWENSDSRATVCSGMWFDCSESIRSGSGDVIG